MSSIARTFLAVCLVALAGCSSNSTAAQPASTVDKTLTTTQAVPAGTEVSVENLLGHVQVRQGGAQLQVTATVVAGGKDHAAAQALADSIRLAVNHDNGKLQVHVDYPVDRYDSYRYIPTAGDHDSHGTLHFLGITIHGSNSSSSLEYQGKQVRVYRGRDEGVPLHVDLIVTLPAGSVADIYNHVGLVEAHDLHNTLTLRSDSGDIVAGKLDGSLHTQSGSGDVSLSDIHGSLAVNTGSGDVKLQRASGDATLHTGSGDIDASALKGGALALDSGSGDIDLDGASGSLQLQTGSGDITLKNLGTLANLRANCGSGDIELHGNLAGIKSFDLQTGSGDVTLTSSQPPAVHLEIQGSDISMDWSGLRNTQTSRHHFSGDVGAASGQGTIRTGSGDVTLKP